MDITKLLLYALIFTIPLDNRVVFTLGIDRLLPARVVLLALLAVSWRRVVKGLNGLKEDKIGLVLVALWLVRLVSLVRTQNLQNSLGLLAFYSAMVGLYFVLKSVFEERGRDFVLKILKLYLLVGVLTGVVSVIQYIFYRFGVVLPAVWPTEHQPARIGSTFWDINHYAAYLLTILPPLAALANWPAFFFVLLSLGMTLSRSGWVAFAFSIFLMVFTLFLKRYFEELKPLLLSLGLLLLVIIIGVKFFNLPVADRLSSFLYIYNNDAIQAHLLILKGGSEIFVRFPFLGCGYGGFDEYFRQTSTAPLYFEKDPVEWAHLPAHSIWMETLAETGIVGFGLYFILMTLVLGTILRAILRTEDRRLNILNIANLSSLVGLLLSGIFYSYNLEFFWFFIFLATQMALISSADFADDASRV